MGVAEKGLVRNLNYKEKVQRFANGVLLFAHSGLRQYCNGCELWLTYLAGDGWGRCPFCGGRLLRARRPGRHFNRRRRYAHNGRRAQSS